MNSPQTNTKSTSTAAFDGAAEAYDAVFSSSLVGKLQRDVVWEYLKKEMPETSQEVLELNCGTGEDAIFLASRGHRVLATDESGEMVGQVAQKAGAASLSGLVKALQMGFSEVKTALEGRKFDWIFSNFGGWNCTDADGIRQMGADLAELLPSGGRLIAVIMPRNTLWEAGYFSLRLSFGKAFRRWGGGPVTAQLNPGTVKVWYHNPNQVQALLAPWFSLKAVQPIGFCVPPSYMDPYFVKKTKMLAGLERQDQKLRGQPWLARFSDHYLIDLIRN